MSSRAEEKERRRREREEQEQAAQRAASRRRAFQVGAAALAVIAAIAVGALLVLGGGDDETSAADAGAVREQARAAGCTFREHRSEGRDHTNERVTYRTNPPTSGSHNPLAAQDGIYKAGNEPNKENWVHSLEHGRIIYQYRPGTAQATIDRLTELAQEELEGSEGYHTLVMQNNTKMQAPLALVAWTRSLTCPRVDDASADAMRSFREAYTDKGPEFVP
jgi:hypothetical protein